MGLDKLFIIASGENRRRRVASTLMFERFKAEKRLKVLEEAHETLERQFKNLRLEWEDTYDKLRGLYQRIAKRAERVERAAASTGEEGPDVAASMAGGKLSDAAERANQEILARRRRGIANSVNREQ